LCGFGGILQGNQGFPCDPFLLWETKVSPNTLPFVFRNILKEPFEETNKALLLLSMQALTTGTDGVFATANPPTLTAPIRKPINTLMVVLFMLLLGCLIICLDLMARD
jgi:hypothetical protein